MQDAVQGSTPSPYAYPLLIKQLLHTPFVQAPDQEIVYRGQLRMTYTTLRERIARLANGLHQLGVRHGSTVAVMDWDSHRYLESYFAVPMMGAVLQTVNVRLSEAEIAYTINHSGAEVLFVHTDFLPVVEAIKDQLEPVRTFVCIDEQGSEASAHTIAFAAEYEAMLAASATSYDFPDFDENTRATTFYTTGTTGLPKGVYFSHRQLVLHTITLMGALSSPVSGQRFHRGDVYMPLTPMFHVHAWGMPYIATVMGVKQVYPRRYAPHRLAQLPPHTGPLELEEEVRLRCKTGFPVPLVDLRIVNENMEDIAHDGRAYGEIVVRAPWLTQGYLNNPDASAQLWTGGYLHTQDIANIDPTGNIQITDRIKDVIKSGGEWISSLEIESLISLHPDVSEVAVIGIKDEKWGERPMALVVLRTGHASMVTEEDIRIHVRAFAEKGVISKYAVPHAVRLIEAIDTTI